MAMFFTFFFLRFGFSRQMTLRCKGTMSASFLASCAGIGWCSMGSWGYDEDNVVAPELSFVFQKFWENPTWLFFLGEPCIYASRSF